VVLSYYIVMILSGIQIVHFKTRLKSLVAFDTQVKIVDFVFPLIGLVESIKSPAYILLFIGTLIVLFI